MLESRELLIQNGLIRRVSFSITGDAVSAVWLISGLG